MDKIIKIIKIAFTKIPKDPDKLIALIKKIVIFGPAIKKWLDDLINSRKFKDQIQQDLLEQKLRTQQLDARIKILCIITILLIISNIYLYILL